MPDAKIVLTDSGQSPLNNLPEYARTVAWIGLPAFLCLFLVWFVTSDIKAQAKQQSTDIAEIKTILIRQAAAEQERTQQTWQSIGIFSRICINTSRTQEDRIACTAMTLPK